MNNVKKAARQAAIIIAAIAAVALVTIAALTGCNSNNSVDTSNTAESVAVDANFVQYVYDDELDVDLNAVDLERAGHDWRYLAKVSAAIQPAAYQEWFKKAEIGGSAETALRSTDVSVDDVLKDEAIKKLVEDGVVDESTIVGYMSDAARKWYADLTTYVDLHAEGLVEDASSEQKDTTASDAASAGRFTYSLHGKFTDPTSAFLAIQAARAKNPVMDAQIRAAEAVNGGAFDRVLYVIEAKDLVEKYPGILNTSNTGGTPVQTPGISKPAGWKVAVLVHWGDDDEWHLFGVLERCGNIVSLDRTFPAPPSPDPDPDPTDDEDDKTTPSWGSGGGGWWRPQPQPVKQPEKEPQPVVTDDTGKQPADPVGPAVPDSPAPDNPTPTPNPDPDTETNEIDHSDGSGTESDGDAPNSGSTGTTPGSDQASIGEDTPNTGGTFVDGFSL